MTTFSPDALTIDRLFPDTPASELPDTPLPLAANELQAPDLADQYAADITWDRESEALFESFIREIS